MTNPSRLRVQWLRAAQSALTVVTIAVTGAACGPANIVLRRLPADQTGVLGPFQRCAAGSQPCDTDPNQDGSRLNNSGTLHMPLPPCPHGIDAVLIQGANTPTPVAVVQCAAPGQTLNPNGGIPVAVPVRPAAPQKNGAR